MVLPEASRATSSSSLEPSYHRWRPLVTYPIGDLSVTYWRLLVADAQQVWLVSDLSAALAAIGDPSVTYWRLLAGWF